MLAQKQRETPPPWNEHFFSHLPEENDGNCIIHDTLTKHQREDVVVHMEVVEDSQHCH